jgi:hypothetical protein
MVIPTVSNTEEKLNTMLLKYVQDLMTRPDQEAAQEQTSSLEKSVMYVHSSN